MLGAAAVKIAGGIIKGVGATGRGAKALGKKVTKMKPTFGNKDAYDFVRNARKDGIGKTTKDYFYKDGKVQKMRTGMAAFSLYQGYDDFNDRIEQGDSFVEAAAGAVASTALYAFHPLLALGYDAASLGTTLGIEGANFIGKYNRELQQKSRNIPFQNSTFVDTQQVYTMRQAGLALAKQARMNTQQSLMGSEARYMHR